MVPKTKTAMFLIAFGVALYAAMMNVGAVFSFLEAGVALIFPILLGLVFAFILNVPMSGFERLLERIFSKAKRKPGSGLLRGVSLVLTLLCIVLVITLALTIAIPELVTSAKSVYPLMKAELPRWAPYLEGYHIDLSQVSEWLSTIDVTHISNGAGSLLSSAIEIASSTVSGVASTVFGIIISVYVLLSKRDLTNQVNKLMAAHLADTTANKIRRVVLLIRDTYAQFLSGQCVEAILLGCLMFLALSLFGLPYAGLTAFLTSLCAFIPYVGAFVSCLIGGFLTLIASPSQVILYLIVYMAVQFVENQFIYPHVVGTSVGLSPLWTLIAALIGGKLFGLPGIIFFIPLVAVLYQLVREHTNQKLANKASASGQGVLAQGATEQGSAVQELNATVSEISDQIKHNAEISKKAGEMSSGATAAIASSNEQMQRLMVSMHEIDSKSKEISKINKDIEDIASQTNILALNAAVEAARAGSAGKGFAVVANEVKKLAAKSAGAAQNTTILIESSIAAINHGVNLAQTTANELENAVEGAKETTKVILEIGQATTEQARAISEISTGLNQISFVVHTNSATSEESAAASEELSGQAGLLRELIGSFKIHRESSVRQGCK